MKQNLKSFLTIPFSFIFFCFAITAYAQTQYTIKGIVADTSSNIKLSNIIISILDMKCENYLYFSCSHSYRFIYLRTLYFVSP